MMNTMFLFLLLLFSSFNFVSTVTYSCDPSISCGCSTSSTVVTSRIVGGELASNHAWGWMVSFQMNGDHQCGASLLTPEYAVTAAHCVEEFLDIVPSLSILAGTNYLDDTNSTTVQRRSIISITIHPDYDSATYTNDIAIIQFSSLLTTSEYNLAFICLPNADEDPFQINTNLVAIGWGYLASNIYIVPNELRQVTVQVASSTSTACTDGGLTDTNSQFCAGVIAGGKGKLFFMYSICNASC
jgi:transmembrane serine protease 9